MTGTKSRADLIVAALTMVVVLAMASFTAHAASNALSKDDQQCLACHSQKGLDKKLENGDKLSLHVDGAAFAESVHNTLGCGACHGDVTLENHPPLKTKIASSRDNSVALAKVCASCHSEIAKLYESGTHGRLLREGNPAAPLCTDCHSPHAVKAKAAYNIATGAPCSTCHSSIFDAYAGSVHGQARKQGRVEAPVCSSCHSAHSVTATAGEEKVKNACYGCHPRTLAAHQAWLPNAGRHLQTVSCAACHAPGAKRKVDLRLYDTASQKRVAEKEGVPQLEMRARAVDAEGKGLDKMALQSLMREFNRDGMEGKVMLRGRLEVSNGEEVHQLAAKGKAVRECESCHRAGSDPFQSVTISIVGPDGRPTRYDAKNEVLNSAVSVESVGGFYVIGGTRIQLLDILVVLALVGGLSVPVLHLTFGWLSRKYAKRIGGRDDS